MAEDSSDNSPLILRVRQAIRGPKAIAVTWDDGSRSIICLWDEVDLSPADFDTESVEAEDDGVDVVPKIRVLDDMTGITWPDRNVTVTAARLAELAEAQGKDPLPPAVFSTWRASLGLDVGAAAKHLAVGEADIRAYEAGSRPTPRGIALLCREWVAGEETAYEKDWAWENYIKLRETVDRAYEASKEAGVSKNKALSAAAHILGWIDGKRHSERSIHFLPWLYKRLVTEGLDGPPLTREAAIEKIRKTYGLASWESARKYLARRIGDCKRLHPDDTAFDNVILPCPTVTKKIS